MDTKLDLPKWFTPDFFEEIFEKKFSLSKDEFIVNIISVKPFGGAGENYTSNLYRAQIEARNVKDESVLGKLSVFVKAMITMPELKQFSVFPKEVRTYNVILPAIEEIWRTYGKEDIKFGPELYKFYSEGADDVIVLEDISVEDGYQVVDRHKGLNVEQTKMLLEKLAKYHAASATHIQLNGLIDGVQFGILVPEMKPFFDKFMNVMMKTYFEVLEGQSFASQYVDKMKKPFNSVTDILERISEYKPENFNVLAHGDMWVNNLLFAHDENKDPKDVRFIDYQNSYYGTPVLDLYNFLLSSVSIDYKVDKFDEFVKYYYDCLAESLKTLGYNQTIPTFEDLLAEMEDKKVMGGQVCTGLLAVVLADKHENASLDMFLQETEEAVAFRRHVFNNPRYIAQAKILLPFLDSKRVFDM